MRREIIPVILAKDFTDFKKKLATIKKLRPIPQWIQIDVVDGKFAPYQTYNAPAKIKNLLRNINFEVDLMVVDPLKHAKAWIKAGAKRILFHVEVFNSHPEHSEGSRANARTCVRDSSSPTASQNDDMWRVIQYINKHGCEIGLALNPVTPISALQSYLHDINAVLLLGVNPGKSGQSFQAPVLKKIRALRKKHSLLPIEVDGGVNLDNTEEILKAGATRIATASALHNASNPQIAYQKFLKVADKFR